MEVRRPPEAVDNPVVPAPSPILWFVLPGRADDRSLGDYSLRPFLKNQMLKSSLFPRLPARDELMIRALIHDHNLT